MWPFNRKKKEKSQVPKARYSAPPPSRVHPDDNSLLNYMLINSAMNNDHAHHIHSSDEPIRHDYPDGGSFGGGGSSGDWGSSNDSSSDSGSSYDSGSDSSSYSSND